MNFKLKNFVTFYKKNMKIEQLLNSQGLSALLSKELPMVTSYKLTKLSKRIAEEVDTFDKARIAKIKELGEPIKDKDGKDTENYKIKDENKEVWEAEYKSLIEQEVSIDVPEITVADLGDIKIAPNQLVGLEWLIKD